MAVVAGACTSPSDDPGTLGGTTADNDATTGNGVCAPGHEGCSCSSPGQTVACGRVVEQYGSYVTCQEGYSTCEGGSWGPCLGDVTVHKSLRSFTNKDGHVVESPLPPTCGFNPCDPNVPCMSYDGGTLPDGATGLLATDSGIALPPTTVIPGDAGLYGDGNGTGCAGLQCQVDWGCSASSQTTLTGTVYDPVMQNPLYNAYVYIPIDPNPADLPAFTSGASCNACSGIQLSAVAVTETDVNGHFTLTNVPTTAKSPNNQIPLVVQMGKWRRVQMLTTVPDCQTTAVPPANSRLPQSMFDGYNNTANIPKMAIASGSADPFECMMLKMGISPAEFQAAGGSGTRRIDFYNTNGLQFQGGTAPSYSNLVGSTTTLENYDVVILPCEGTQDDGNEAYAGNVAAYTLAGGRMFTTHYGYTWLATPNGNNNGGDATNPSTNKPNIFYPVAKWNYDTEANSTTGQIQTNFPKGATFQTWMDQLPAPNVGAVTTGAFSINSPRYDTNSVNTSYATTWVTDEGNIGENGIPLSFTLNTPLGAGVGDSGATACGRVVYSDFHVSTSDIVSNNGQCTTTADCGYGSTCSGATTGTCTPVSCGTVNDCPDTTYACTGGTVGTCAEPSPQCQSKSDCYGGKCNSSGQCACKNSGQCGGSPCVGGVCGNTGGTCTNSNQCPGNEICSGGVSGTCTHTCTTSANCTGGEICVAGQCTGCTSGQNCPSGTCNGGALGTCSGNSSEFPAACAVGPLNAQESALEFMLLDLTACISPDNQPPPPPPQPITQYNPASFNLTLASSCPSGTHVRWTELDWQATIPSAEADGATPSGSSIVFAAQTVDPPTDGGAPNFSGAQSVTLATATTTTANLPTGWNAALIDTSPTDGGAGAGAFNKASPVVTSKGDLLLTITLNPSTDKQETPTLINWLVKSDCPASE